MQQAGKLNQRVTVQRPAAGEDARGQPLTGWQDVATVWANVLHKSGLETMKADAPASVVQASIRIRWRTDIDATMRVLVGLSAYQVRAVLPDMVGRDHVDLVCEIVT